MPFRSARIVLAATAAILTVICSCPVSAYAQITDTPVPERIWNLAARNNWYVRVVTPESDTLLGRVRLWRGEVRVAGAAIPNEVALVDRRITRGGGMYLGAAVGFLAGAFVLGGLSGNSETASSTDMWIAALGGGAGGAVLGLFAGHAAAPGRTTWEPVWP